CRRAVGYFPEYAPFYPDLSVRAYLDFVARLKRIPRRARADVIGRALAACALETVAHRRVGTLSKGYRQRVGLAQALLGDPPILILDEPTIGLDPGQVVEMRELLDGLRGARTVFFSSHVIAEVAALCERVIVVAHGRLVAEGSPAELRERLRGRRRAVLRVDGPPAEVAAALAAVPLVLAGYRFYTNLGFFVLMGGTDLARGLWQYQLLDVEGLLLVLVPLLTMRLFAEERKLGTLELLWTYPVSDAEIVVGKFVACLAVVVVLPAVSAVHPAMVARLYVVRPGPLLA